MTGLALRVSAPRPEAVAAAGEQGAAIEVRWDHEMIALEAVAPDCVVTAPVRVTPGPHILELESVAGGRVLPGAVRLASTPE